MVGIHEVPDEWKYENSEFSMDEGEPIVLDPTILLEGEPTTHVDNNQCVVCMSEGDLMFIDTKCGHKICKSCFNEMR